MSHDFLLHVFIFLAATCLVVPLAGRFQLGSVLGYIASGILIGPFALGLIQNSERIMHFGEFGVIMMLFLIGLELEPPTLWRLRKTILGMGGLQVAVTGALFSVIGVLMGFTLQVSLVAGFALALSSTAIVLQMLEEKGLFQTSAGKSSFAVLLFQDIAVIPFLILLPIMAGISSPGQHHAGLLSTLPGWQHALVVTGTISLLIVGGHYFSSHMFRFVARANAREVFTAISLAVVAGNTLLMQMLGLSPALGAFMAGVVLANSEYRHTLEADLKPFKALLLGLFFTSIGMGMDFDFFRTHVWSLLAAVIGLMAAKILVLLLLGRLFGLRGPQNTLFAIALAQGGEFGFVLFQYASGWNILSQNETAFLTMVVTLSMALTPLLLIVNERLVIPRFLCALPRKDYDVIENNNTPVLIAGYGRFGQIIGRFLTSQGIQTTVLEKDPDQVTMLRKFGHQGFFGDASRQDLLENAGAAKAKLLIVAVDDPDKSLEIVRMAKRSFPNLQIIARARNRRHAYELHKVGADYFRRETFDASLIMAREAARRLGITETDALRRAILFTEHDEHTLKESFAIFDQEPDLIAFSRQANGELESILRQDQEKTST